MPEHDLQQTPQGMSIDVMYERIHGDIKVINNKYDNLDYLFKQMNSKLDTFEKDIKQTLQNADNNQTLKINSALGPINASIGDLKTTVDKVSEKTGANMIDIAKVVAVFTPVSAILVYFLYQLINQFVNK